MASSAPVPIAFCITELNFGGAERMLVELATRIDRGRFAAVVYSLAARPAGDDERLALRLEEAGVPVRFFGGSGVRHAPRVLRQLTQALQQQRPAILQNFLWHANTLGTLAGGVAGVPHIVSGIRVTERRRNPHRWIARRATRLVERHVCVSRAVADFSAREVGLPAERLVVIPNGIEVEQYPAPAADLAALDLPAGRRAILFAGRLSPQKRIDWLLERTPAIFAELPEHDLLVVGRGRELPRLQNLAERLGVGGRVHFLGWRSDLPAILAASDLLVLTSRAEGMPNVVLEAMASAKPVAATEAEGVGELLGPAADEQVAPRDDAAGFVRNVVRIASDAALAERLGGENRARAATEFSLSRMVARYEQLYLSLLPIKPV